MQATIDFETYRQWFYFFQYQFFVRSEQGKKREYPKSRIATFLKELATDSTLASYRYRIPKPDKPKKPRGRPQLKEMGKDPMPFTGGQPVFYRAKRESIRTKFMLFEMPTNSRKDDIPLLIKCLIVCDLQNAGMSPYAITKKLINEKTTFDAASTIRGCYHWYDELFDRCLGKFECREPLPFADNALIATDSVKLDDNLLRGDREKQHIPVKSRVSDVHRYSRLANILIQLAVAGQFKNYPSKIRIS